MNTAVNRGGPKRLDLVGQRFGMLLVLKKMPTDNVMTRFLCLCDCGQEKVLIGYELKRGNWKSCGCNRTPRTTYEYRDHPLYDVWKGMKARCGNKNHVSYKSHGGKGVTVCEAWANDFLTFYRWAVNSGWMAGLHLDKDIIPKRKGEIPLLYSPENCLWVTPAENARAAVTTRLTMEDAESIRISSKKATEIAKEYNVSVSHILKIKNNKSWKR